MNGAVLNTQAQASHFVALILLRGSVRTGLEYVEVLSAQHLQFPFPRKWRTARLASRAAGGVPPASPFTACLRLSFTQFVTCKRGLWLALTL